MKQTKKQKINEWTTKMCSKMKFEKINNKQKHRSW